MDLTLEETDLYVALKTNCAAGGAKPLDADKLFSMVKTAARAMGDMLNRACINFDDYTLHDEHHAVRVVHLAGRLMGAETIGRLNAVEMALLILAAYGHDCGMAIEKARRDELRQSEEYKDFLLRNEQQWLEAEEARERGDSAGYEFLSSRLFQDFLRSRHHLLSEELMLTAFEDHLEIDGKSLAAPVAALCKSHGQSVAELADLEPFPFATVFLCEMPFLACVLCLGDYLDLDASRAPQTLFDLIKPGEEKSRREWRKHQASNFFVTDAEIRFQARFDDFFEEKALRDTLAGIDKQRQECMDLLRDHPNKRGLTLKLSTPLHKEITSEGYVFEEFRFQLEYKEIMSLLMGTRLYKDERVFVRELLQNSLDACRHAEAAAGSLGRQKPGGKIVVRTSVTPSGEHVLEVCDNGSGMTRNIIRDYFMRIGRSFYHSFAFRQQRLPFHAVSQFGIGVLSCFMYSDYIEVETCPDAIAHRNEKSLEHKTLKLEVRGPLRFFVVRELDRDVPGTTVRVVLRKPLLESIGSLVNRYVARIPYTVEIQEHGKAPVDLKNEPFDFSAEQFRISFLAIPGAFGYASKDLEFEGRFGFDLRGRIRFFMLEAGGRRFLQLRDTGKYSFVGFSVQGETLVNAKQFTKDVRTPVDTLLSQVRAIQGSFPAEVRSDIANILRQFHRLCDDLSFESDPTEVRALCESLKAQIGALCSMMAFQIHPSCIQVEAHLNQAVREVESFVTGQFRLAAPLGLLTQDGINITSMINLPASLHLGIGHLYNLDLCGKHRLSLSAARDQVIFDERSKALLGFLHEQIGRFLGQWFREEKVPDDQVQQYIGSVPQTLARAAQESFRAKR